MATSPSIDASSKKPLIGAAALSSRDHISEAKVRQSASESTAQSTVPVQEQLAAGAAFKDNVLFAYDNVAYYFRLTMVNPGLADQLDPGLGVVLAETGTTTDLVIKDCVLNHIVGWSSKSQGAFAHSGKITILEPLGVRFLDKIVTAARALRIPNHTQARYLLELGFTGRDPVTGNPVIIPTGNHKGTGSANTSNANFTKSHIWQIFFTKVDMTIDRSGGLYSIEFSNQLEAAQENTVENLREVINIPANSIKEYFAGLAAALNQKEKNDVGITKFVPNEYQFIVDPMIADYKFANFNPSKIHTSKNSQEKDGKNVPTFREGTGILGLINVVMSGTSEFQRMQKLKTGASKTDNEGTSTKKNTERADITADLSVFFRVQTWCECGEFDFFINDYQKKLTYFIFPTLTPQLTNQSEQEAAISKDFGAYITAQKIKALENSKLLSKEYQYAYTGLNTSVLDFNIQLNNSAYLSIMPSDGSYSADAARPGSKIDPTSTAELLKQKQDIKRKWETNRTQIKKLVSENGSSSEISRLREENKNISAVLTQEQSIKSKALGPLTIFGAAVDSSSVPRLHYVDDKVVQEINEKDLDPNYIANRFLEDDVGSEIAGGGIEGANSKNRGLFSYMFNQLRSTANLVDIKVKIVGDPFWFGRDSGQLARMRKDVAGKKTILAASETAELQAAYADFEKGAPYFYIKFQGPMDYNPATGYMEFSTSDVISGVYVTKKVTSNFDNGQFTQVLEAFKDVSILNAHIPKSKEQFTKELNNKLVSDKEFGMKNKKELQDLANSKDPLAAKAKERLDKL